MDNHPPIELWLERIDNRWFGAALDCGKLVATDVASSRDEAARILKHCLPDNAPWRYLDAPDEAATATIRMLAAIEKGDESVKRFELSTLYVPEPNASVFRLAAAIPCGYVCTYGNIASIARTNARVVGRLMATNPLYPIVPCHRVVGADMKLVGYGGKTDEEALGAKLSRLRSETRGFTEKLELTEAGGLYIYPAEWVIAKSLVVETDQLTLW